MAAFNYIETEGRCPACHTRSIVRAQTHVASSFDGDSSGRFCDRTYKLGDEMAWWPPADGRCEEWHFDADPHARPAVREACYATCTHCRAELCMVLEFQALRPTQVISITHEEDWPSGYLR